jgi:hypothetical protein
MEPDKIPKDTRHLMLLNCYFCAMENQLFQYNVVEVTILEERGNELSGYENAYFLSLPNPGMVER